jgi:hypothetical protein
VNIRRFLTGGCRLGLTVLGKQAFIGKLKNTCIISRECAKKYKVPTREKNMTLKNLLLGAAAAIAFSFTGAGGPLLTISEAAAEECNRGTLDEAYCDRNFDQTAD